MSQPWSRPACSRAVTLAKLLHLKQDWLDKGDKDKTLSVAAFGADSTLLACLLSTACPDTICMARYGMFAAGTLGSHMSDRMDASCKGPEECVEHDGAPKTDSAAKAQSGMLVHTDWLPCISSCMVLPASRRQHAQKGMLQQ